MEVELSEVKKDDGRNDNFRSRGVVIFASVEVLGCTVVPLILHSSDMWVLNAMERRRVELFDMK